ncbi:MAG: polyphosphate polymerase domain-containing protein [Cyclobacteriaceae bacterium]
MKQFKTISLSDIQKVSLMNRVDKKFILNTRRLTELYRKISEFYFALEINGTCHSIYQTQYFDTANNDMYKAHHNGKLNRFKIRHRSYSSTGLGFLELKYKTNKGRTIKSRIPSSNISSNSFSREEKDFIISNTPYSASSLSVALNNQFSRTTLANKQLNERCTIDTNLHFSTLSGETIMNNVAIIEVKSEKGNNQSLIIQALNDMGIKSGHFSKYCNGLAMVNTGIKHNSFKRRMRLMKKNLSKQQRVN